MGSEVCILGPKITPPMKPIGAINFSYFYKHSYFFQKMNTNSYILQEVFHLFYNLE
ncbi:hypothetical protein GCM10008931_21140 [Oceanobacillus oncorhynchi subsp. oncorhynchi]